MSLVFTSFCCRRQIVSHLTLKVTVTAIELLLIVIKICSEEKKSIFFWSIGQHIFFKIWLKIRKIIFYLSVLHFSSIGWNFCCLSRKRLIMLGYFGFCLFSLSKAAPSTTGVCVAKTVIFVEIMNLLSAS